jgi:hypothetical protein
MSPAPSRHAEVLDPVALGLAQFGAAAIEAYEASVRSVEDLQRAAARGLRFGPARDALASSAALTRDLGAVNASWARWILGL